MTVREIRYRVVGGKPGGIVEKLGDRTSLRHRMLVVDDEGNVIIAHSDRRDASHDVYLSGAEARLVAREVIRHAIASLFRRR